MKVLKLLFAVLVLLVSCSKDKPGITAPPPATDTLGAGWSKVTVPNAGFSDIVFIDNNTGFAVGDQGLHKSGDGGKTWQLTSTRFSGDGYLAATADGKVFVILEHTDTLYRSFDGGITFSAIKMNAPMPLTDIYFTGNDTGYVPAGKNALLRTTDGGHNWETVGPVTGLNLGPGNFIPFFINGTTGWISDGHTIFHTMGSVNSWDSSKNFPIQPSINSYITLAATDANVVYAAVKAITSTSVYKSIDGGVHFSLAGEVASSTQGYADIHFINANTGYLSTNKSIFATSDGGANWTKVVTMANDFVTEIHFIDSDHGWACGTKGCILIFKR